MARQRSFSPDSDEDMTHIAPRRRRRSETSDELLSGTPRKRFHLAIPSPPHFGHATPVRVLGQRPGSPSDDDDCGFDLSAPIDQDAIDRELDMELLQTPPTSSIPFDFSAIDMSHSSATAEEDDGPSGEFGLLTPPARTSRMQATPDPTAFSSPVVVRRRGEPSPFRSAQRVRPPSPPQRRPALRRKSSLWDTKTLYETHVLDMPDTVDEDGDLMHMGDGDDADDDADAEESPYRQTGTMNSFEILSTLGCGSFFTVFKARRKRDGKLFAIKQTKRLFRGKMDRQRYLQEIKAVAVLPPHRNIVTYYSAWQEELHLYIQLELCSHNLSDVIESQQGPMDPSLVWYYALQIANGLAYVHKHHVVHLDIKPENLLISEDGVVKIGDFGQAFQERTGNSPTALMMQNVSFNPSVRIGNSTATSRTVHSFEDGGEGDARYVAPECLDADSQETGPPADMFSFGLVVFELVTAICLTTGGPLWRDLRAGHAAKYLPSSDHPEQQDLNRLILSLLQPDPHARMSARQVLQTWGNKYASVSLSS